MRDSTSYADPGLKMRDFGYCFDSKVEPGAPLSVKAPHSQSNLKSPQTLATANFSTLFIISIAVLENVPPDAGLQKRATFPH
jgi:hypothetical protein